MSRVIDEDELASEFRAMVRSAWIPPLPLVRRPEEPVFSRWLAGPTSLGPRTKIVLTVLALAILVRWSIGWPHPALMVAFTPPMVLGIGLFLRALWRRARIR